MLKRLVRESFIERLARGLQRKPLGALLRREEVRRRIPALLYDDVLWLNDGVYRFGKHEYADWPEEIEDDARLFDLDEAIAIYYIARCLGWQLLQEALGHDSKYNGR